MGGGFSNTIIANRYHYYFTTVISFPSSRLRLLYPSRHNDAEFAQMFRFRHDLINRICNFPVPCFEINPSADIHMLQSDFNVGCERILLLVRKTPILLEKYG